MPHRRARLPVFVGRIAVMVALGLGVAGLLGQDNAPIRPATQPAAPAKDLPLAADLLEGSIKAMGGKEALQGIDSIAIKAIATTPQGDAAMLMQCNEIGAFLLHQELGDISSTVGSDGETCWMLNTGKGQPDVPQLIPKPQAAEVRKELHMYMYRVLADPAAYFQATDTIDQVEFKGQPSYKLRMVFKDQPESEHFWYLGQVDMMLLGIERKIMTPDRGEVPTTLLFSEWKPFQDGALKLFTKLTIEQPGMEASITYNEIQFNNVDPAVFDLPAEVEALLNPPATAPAGGAPATKPAATQPATAPATQPS